MSNKQSINEKPTSASFLKVKTYVNIKYTNYGLNEHYQIVCHVYKKEFEKLKKP